MAQMREAMKKAGFVSAEDRLMDIAIKAMVKHADNTHDTVETIWATVSKDLPLMIALFERERWNAIRGLIYRTRQAISSREQRGELRSALDRRAAVVVNNLKADDERIRREEKAAETAEQAKADKEFEERIAAWRATPIGNLEVSGVPVWQVSPTTARLWAQSQGRRWRCVELLCDGLPDDNRPIEYYRKPEEVAAIWRLTEQAAA